MGEEREVDLDLDQARSARREKGKKGPTIRFGGETFALPPIVPFGFVDAFESGKLAAAVRALFGEKQYRAFMAHDPDVEDVDLIASKLKTLYSVTQGESRASGGSSRRTSGRSRPTSSGSTG